jgi:hypothetical protein
MAKITIPLDASGVEGLDPKQPVKVLVVARGVPLAAEIVTLDKKGQAQVSIGIEEKARDVRVIVGPPDATNDELLGLQTIGVDIPLRRWAGKDELVIPAIRVTPYYWFWWLRWCRTFTIHGTLRCPDGRPVPGAVVCAYDVDAWWWWWSRQQVGCATTDANGAFAITFRWCCGWWPWWWWRYRAWEVEPTLSKDILRALQREPRFPRIPQPDPQPDLRIFQSLLASTTELAPSRNGNPAASFAAELRKLAPVTLGGTPTALDPAQLDALRDGLVEVLPRIPELSALRLWPWWPWYPWWDCTPDIVFRATQACGGAQRVIVNESWFQARWNIPQQVNVSLTANSEACCVARPPQCDGDCLALSDVCGYPTFDVGGNAGAPAAPPGYANPQPVAATANIYSDRPFADTVTIRGTIDCLADVDYYRVKWRPFGGGAWNPMPVPALGAFSREYWDFSLGHSVFVPFSATVPISGLNVYETVQHYEATHTPADWGASKVWLATNYDVVMEWLTNGTFGDGTYELSLLGYDEVAGVLQNEHSLLVCGGDQPATIVVTIDNQVTYAAPGPNPATNPCGGVHACTDEPATEIYDAYIVHQGGGTTTVSACGTIKLAAGDQFRVDFAAYDAAGHLAYYDLRLTYDNNLVTYLPLIPANLSALGGKPVPAALQTGSTYGEARVQGAPSPTWAGGAIRFECPATDVFLETCCYQLELRAYKRTVVSCYGGFAHANLSERSFQVTV